MGGSGSQYDALNSPGFDAQRLQGDRLEHLQRCAMKAASTYPPAFVAQNQVWSSELETPAGNEALRRGRWANSQRSPAPKDSGRTGKIAPGFVTKEEIDRELGSVDGLFTLFGLHYCGMFANPRMQVLFDTRDPDSASSAFDHGKRIASTLLDECHHTSYFRSLNRGYSGAFAVMGTHKKAKACPMRPQQHLRNLPEGSRRGGPRFTCNQRDSWVGHIMWAADEVGASKQFEEKLGVWLAMIVSAYAPFADEATGTLDWMEESPYS